MRAVLHLKGKFDQDIALRRFKNGNPRIKDMDFFILWCGIEGHDPSALTKIWRELVVEG